MAGMVPDEIGNVGVRLRRDVARERERRDEDAAFDLPAGVYVRNIPDEEMAGPDFDVIAFVAEPLQIGATTYQSA